MVCACAAVSNNKSLQLTLSYLLHFVFVLSHADSYSVTVLTWNSMGNSEILDKYHECCFEIHEVKPSPFPLQQEWYLSKISLLPMLFTSTNY